MGDQHYALVFVRDFGPGEHWHDQRPAPAAGERHNPQTHRPDHDDADRKQHWRTGDLYSVGTVLADPLPGHLKAIQIPEPQPGQVWDRQRARFADPPAA